MTQPPVDTFEHAGLTVNILWEEFDQEHANPRENDGNLGVMFCDYRGYSLGDSDADDPRDRTGDCPVCGGSGDAATYDVIARHTYARTIVKRGFASCEAAERYIERNQPDDAEWMAEIGDCPNCEGEGEVELSIIDYLKVEHGARVILPLMVYEHSGITMRVGRGWKSKGQFVGDDAGWDTSLVGVIYDTKASRDKRGYGDEVTDDDIEKWLTEEVAYYAAYLEGSVFGYEILDSEGEELDSCWGFLELNVHKDDAYVRTAAKDQAEYQARLLKKEAAEAHRQACADIVTLP